MLDFVIFAVTFVTGLIIFVFYLYPGSRKTGTTIPGMEPSDARDGNLADIVSAGSLHEFLTKLHSEYGPIASFWMGTQFVVSLASPELFEQQQYIFDRPVELFEGFRWLLGDNSIFFANGTQARSRHESLAEHFQKLSQDEGTCRKISLLAEELAGKLATVTTDEHVPLGQWMTGLSMKILSLLVVGENFTNDFLAQFEILHAAIESKLLNQSVTPDAVEKEISSALKKVRTAVEDALKKVPDTLPVSKQNAVDDCITVIQQGCHTMGNLLTWVMYYVAANQDVQDKLYEEISQVDEITAESIHKFSYTRSVVDESLRMSALVPYAARCQSLNLEVGGHLIPKGTPVIHAIGVVAKDEEVWTMPNSFSPDRFGPESQRHPLAFTPWGFAGKRQCPGRSLAINAVIISVAIILKSLAFGLVGDQVVFPSYGLSTKPRDEIWVTVTKRK